MKAEITITQKELTKQYSTSYTTSGERWRKTDAEKQALKQAKQAVKNKK